MAQLDDIIRCGPAWSAACIWQLGARRLRQQAHGRMIHRRLSAPSNPLVDEETRKLRAFLYDGGLLPKTPVTARALMKTAKRGGYPAFLADLRDGNGRPFRFSARRRSRPFFPLSLPARPACRSMPAPPSGNRRCAS